MIKKTVRKVFAITLLAFASGSQAAFLIDDFSVETDYIFIQNSETSILGSSSDFSTERTLMIEEHPGSIDSDSDSDSDSDIFVFVDADDGVLEINTGVDSLSDTTSRYSNAVGFDFRQAEQITSALSDVFVLTLLSIDQGGVEISLVVDGVLDTQLVNAAGDVLFSHSTFGDVSSVKNIELLIHNNEEVDVTFDAFMSYGRGSSTPDAHVPEPTVITLFAIGLTGLGFVRRRA